jgi:hypothetical protein
MYALNYAIPGTIGWYARCPICDRAWVADFNKEGIELISFCSHLSHAIRDNDNIYFILAGKDIIVDRKR